MPHIRDVSEQISALFPNNPDDIQALVNSAKEAFEQEMGEVLALSDGERTEENTLRAYDSALGRFGQKASSLHAISMMSTDSEMRKSADQGYLTLSVFMDQWILGHPDLYQAMKQLEGVELSGPGAYFLKETLSDLEHGGLHLDAAAREKLGAL